jgi:hypothetical protein
VVTLASGNLGLVSFPRIPHRVSLEELEESHPLLVSTLRDHPGVAFMLVRSRSRGPVVIGKSGIHYLETGTVEGDDPLAPFGPNAAAKALRTDGFAHVADLMVNSTYWPALEEVAAFEELVGSHGAWAARSSIRSSSPRPSSRYPGRCSSNREQSTVSSAAGSHRSGRTPIARRSPRRLWRCRLSSRRPSGGGGR